MHLLPQLWVTVSCDNRGTAAMGLRVGAGGLPAAQFAICTSMFSIDVFWRRANAIIVWNDHVSLFQSTPVGWHVFMNICRHGIKFFFCPRPAVAYETSVSMGGTLKDGYWELVARAMIISGFACLPFDSRRLACSIRKLVPRNGKRPSCTPINTVRAGIGYLEDLKVDTFNPDQTQWPEWNNRRLPAVPLGFDETWVQPARGDRLQKMTTPLAHTLVIDEQQNVLLTREGALRAEAELRSFLSELPAAQRFDSANSPSDCVTREITRCFGTLGHHVVPYAVELHTRRGVKLTGEAQPALKHPASSQTFWATAADKEVEVWRAHKSLCAISVEIDVVCPTPDFATREFRRMPKCDAKVLRQGSGPDDFLRSLVASGHGKPLTDLGHDVDEFRPAPRREAVPEATRAEAEAVAAAAHAKLKATATARIANEAKCPTCGLQRCPTFGPACGRLEVLTEEDEVVEELVIAAMRRCLRGEGFKKLLQKDIAKRAKMSAEDVSHLINRKMNVRCTPTLSSNNNRHLPNDLTSPPPHALPRCVGTGGAFSAVLQTHTSSMPTCRGRDTWEC